VETARRDPILWRCRRGMRELDVLLERFAREQYRSASPERKLAFERLLELPDPLLVDLLLAPGDSLALHRSPRTEERAPLGAPGPEGLAVDRDLAEIAALVVSAARL